MVISHAFLCMKIKKENGALPVGSWKASRGVHVLGGKLNHYLCNQGALSAIPIVQYIPVGYTTTR